MAVLMLMIAMGTAAQSQTPDRPGGSDDALQSGSVTLPWIDVKPLLKEMLAPDDPQKPPAPYLLESAAWRGELKDNHVELTADGIFTVLTADGWVKAPIASANAIIKSVSMNGLPVGLHEDAGLLHIVTNEPGRHTLSLTLQAPITGSGKSSGSARFHLAPFPQNTLTLALPSPDYEVTIPQSAVVDMIKEGPGSPAAVAVFGRTSVLELRWERKVTVAEGARIPTKISTRTFSQFSVGEGLMVIRDRINYSILHNPVTSLKVEVPVRAPVSSVEGPGVKGWRVDLPQDMRTEMAMLEVTFAKETQGEGYFLINREMPLMEDEAGLTLPIIHPLAAERNTGWVGVSASANVECMVAGSQKLTQTDVEEAPALLADLSPDPLVLVFKFTEGPTSLTLALRRFETLPVLTTIVDHADYTVLLTEDGKLLTRAVFQTRNNRNQYLQIALPYGASIWSSFVAGEPIKPAMDDNGFLLLVLKKSFTIGEQSQAFPVEIVYLQELEDFESRDRLNLMLARPDVPVSRAFVTLRAPKDFKLRSFRGTFKSLKKPEPEYLPPPMPYAAHGYDISQMPIPAEADYDEERVVAARRAGAPAFGAATATDAWGSPFAGLPQRADAGAAPADWYYQYGAGAQMKTSRGLLPIPIDIPAGGTPYYFGKTLSTDEEFLISFTYRKKWLF